VEFNALAEDSEESFNGRSASMACERAYRLAYGYWQYAVRTDFNGGVTAAKARRELWIADFGLRIAQNSGPALRTVPFQ